MVKFLSDAPEAPPPGLPIKFKMEQAWVGGRGTQLAQPSWILLQYPRVSVETLPCSKSASAKEESLSRRSLGSAPAESPRLVGDTHLC